MKKILFVLVSSVVIIATFFSGCASQSVKAGLDMPPVDWVTARTVDGNGVITLVMRTYDSALTLEDIQYIKEYTESLLDTVYKPDGPTATSYPEISDEVRLVVYCYAAYANQIPDSFSGMAGNEDSCESAYSDAMEWFTVELAGEEHIYF